jgi:hypothetical protein
MDLHDATSANQVQVYVRSSLKAFDSSKSRFLVLFFDEINTTFSMDAVASLMCDRKWRDIELPAYVRLAAACNPLRQLERVQEIDKAWLPRASRKEIGVFKPYQVLPLTPRLERFCWNFGSLTGCRRSPRNLLNFARIGISPLRGPDDRFIGNRKFRPFVRRRSAG